MGLSKKKFRKRIKEEPEEHLESRKKSSDKKGQDALAETLLGTTGALFTENTGKGEVKKRREALRADRFKEKESVNPSKTDQLLIKRVLQKEQNRAAAGIQLPVKKSKRSRAQVEEEELGELDDLWAAPKKVKSKKFEAWKDGFAKRDFVKVQAVVKPASGQSYNPHYEKHQRLLKEVADKEEEIIQKNLKELKAIRPLLFEQDGQEQESDSEQESEKEKAASEQSEEVEGVERKPVNRDDLKTTAQRNKGLLHAVKERAVQEEKARRKFYKDVDNMDKLVRVDKNEAARLAKRLKKQKREEAEEIQRQKDAGVVRKAKVIGRFKYTQRKQDFQLEDDLSANLRQLKPLGNDSLLGDRFDSIFRRNLVEPDAPTPGEKKRQRKQKYKMVNRLGTKAEQLYKETMALKAKNDEIERGAKQFKDNSDVIMI